MDEETRELTESIENVPQPQVQAEPSPFDHNRDDFRKMMIQGNQAQVATIRNEVQQLARDYENRLRQTIELGQQLADHYARIKMLQDATGEEYDDQLRMICELPQVIGVRVAKPQGQRGDSLVVFTDKTFCEDPRTGIRHLIGRHKIVINLEQRNISVFNLDFTIIGHGGERMQAPHVFAAGNLCMGTAASDFRKLLSFRDCFQLVLLTLQFLESVNVEDAAGKFIDCWPWIHQNEKIRCYGLVTCKHSFRREEGDPEALDPQAEGWQSDERRRDQFRNRTARDDERFFPAPQRDEEAPPMDPPPPLPPEEDYDDGGYDEEDDYDDEPLGN